MHVMQTFSIFVRSCWQDERTLRRYARAVKDNACQGLRERLRELEYQEARAVIQLSKSKVRCRRDVDEK